MLLNLLIAVAVFIVGWMVVFSTSDMTEELWQDVKSLDFFKANGYLILVCMVVFTFVVTFWALAFLMDCGV